MTEETYGGAPSQTSSEGAQKFTPESLENIRKVRDLIAKLPHWKFNMRNSGTGGCGSPACIMGWAETLMQPDAKKWKDFSDYKIGEWMGLNPDEGENLFYPATRAIGDGRNTYDSTPIEAVRVLDHLIATGEVDWSIAASAEDAQ